MWEESDAVDTGSRDRLAPGLCRCACWWQGRQDKRRRGGIAASRVDARSPRMPGACWGCAEQGWTSGGALQDGPGHQGRVGRAWQVVTASRMNRPSSNKSRIVGQTWPIPTLHPSSPPARSPSRAQPSPTTTIVQAVPTPWIVLPFPFLPFARPSPDSLDLSPATASLASAGVRLRSISSPPSGL